MLKKMLSLGVLSVTSFFIVPPVVPASAAEVTAATAQALPVSPVFPKFDLAHALEEEHLTPVEIQKMEKGEVLVKSRPVPKGHKGTHVAAFGLIRGTTEQVFDVVMDCAGQPKFVPHLEACKNTYAAGVLPDSATQYEQYQKLKFGFAFISKTIEYTNNMFAIRPYVSGWVLKKGDIDESEGYWRVIPYQDGKQIIIYDVYNNPGMAVPDWVQEILVKSDLPNTVKVFRDRVQTLNGKAAK